MASHRTTVIAAVVPVGFLLSGALVWQASYAAFTATTENTGNTWQAGTVALSDNDAGSALFTATGLVPGSTGERCIEVFYTGDVAAEVRLYATPGPNTALAPYLTMEVEYGTAQDAGCSGWVQGGILFNDRASELSTHSGFTTGLGSWTPAGSATRWYRFAYELVDDNEAQGDSLDLSFTWEAQSS